MCLIFVYIAEDIVDVIVDCGAVPALVKVLQTVNTTVIAMRIVISMKLRKIVRSSLVYSLSR
jgi:hypothetical protein